MKFCTVLGAPTGAEEGACHFQQVPFSAKLNGDFTSFNFLTRESREFAERLKARTGWPANTEFKLLDVVPRPVRVIMG